MSYFPPIFLDSGLLCDSAGGILKTAEENLAAYPYYRTYVYLMFVEIFYLILHVLAFVLLNSWLLALYVCYLTDVCSECVNFVLSADLHMAGLC